MKTLLVFLLAAGTAVAQPSRPNPCGGKPMPPRPMDPCGGLGAPRQPPPPPRPARVEADPKKTYAIKVDAMDGVDGEDTALVTIVDTSDYACPYCEKARPTLAALKAKYSKDLRIVYKQFVMHPQQAMAGSLAACAANKQHKFAEVDAALWAGYKAQKLDKDVDGKHCWQSKEGCPVANAAAKDAKLDTAKFMADMTACESELKSSMADMASFGVAAIPTFFINGRVLTGAQPQASFEAIIDEELAKANAKIKAGEKPNRYYQHWVIEKGEKPFAARPANPCGGSMRPRPANPCGGGM